MSAVEPNKAAKPSDKKSELQSELKMEEPKTERVRPFSRALRYRTNPPLTLPEGSPLEFFCLRRTMRQLQKRILPISTGNILANPIISTSAPNSARHSIACAALNDKEALLSQREADLEAFIGASGRRSAPAGRRKNHDASGKNL